MGRSPGNLSPLNNMIFGIIDKLEERIEKLENKVRSSVKEYPVATAIKDTLSGNYCEFFHKDSGDIWLSNCGHPSRKISNYDIGPGKRYEVIHEPTEDLGVTEDKVPIYSDMIIFPVNIEPESDNMRSPFRITIGCNQNQAKKNGFLWFANQTNAINYIKTHKKTPIWSMHYEKLDDGRWLKTTKEIVKEPTI